jgi:hypothetical protein
MEQLLENDDEHFPNHWTKDEWQDTYKWLTNSRGVLGCSTCKSARKAGPMKTHGLDLQMNGWRVLPRK